MATSGTYTEHPNNLAIIKAALRKLGRLGDAESFADTDNRYTSGLAALKLIVKEYAALGMPLWAIEELSIAMSNFTDEYGVTIAVSGGDVTATPPLKILGMIRRDSIDATNPIDTPMMVYDQDTYMWIPNKSSTGAPNFYTYYPQDVSAVNPIKGTLKIWPLPDTYWTTNGSIIVRYQRPIQDVGTSTQDLDFPVEWSRAVVYALAADLSTEYGVDPNKASQIQQQAIQALARAEGFGTEEGSLFIQPKKR